MKSISESARGVAVVIASVMLAATIFTMPVKAAEPTTYIQSGTIWSESAGEYQVLMMLASCGALPLVFMTTLSGSTSR